MLTKEERIAALERVRDDQGGTENKRFKKEQVFEALYDVRTWLIILTTMLSESADLDLELHLQILSSQTASIPNGALSNCKHSILLSVWLRLIKRLQSATLSSGTLATREGPVNAKRNFLTTLRIDLSRL